MSRKLWMQWGIVCYASPLVAIVHDPFLQEQTFVTKGQTWHVEGDYSILGRASIEHATQKMHYREGNISLFASHFFHEEHALSWQLGMHCIDLGWHQNPYFSKQSYPYMLSSVNWISQAVAKWRWKMGAGVSFNAETFLFGPSAVYYGTLWGRYTQNSTLDLHLGFFGYYGVHNGYLLPILGVDWWMAPAWQLRAIFPQEVGVRYHPTHSLVASLLATSMGGPYRFPYRIDQGITQETDFGIFKVFSTAVELNLELHFDEIFRMGAGGGYDFGGFVLTMNAQARHKHYSFFDGAPYARFFASATF